MSSLAQELVHYTHDPYGYVCDLYPWGEGSLKDHAGVRDWQAQILKDIGAHLQNPVTRYQPLRIAVASGHGIGKSAEVSFITDWGLSTCDDCRVLVTANTETQLRTKTWPEVIKWFGLSRSKELWKTNALSICSTESDHEKLWRADAIPWSEKNTEAFAGLHNKGKRIIIIFDEASSIPDKVWEVAEGALTDENTELIWLVFGNPTRNTGKFKDCFTGRERRLWKSYQIDSRTVEGTNKQYLDELVQTYGEDSDFVKVRVRGMFPSASVKQFISVEDVDAAFGRHLREEQYNFAPVIIAVDSAWEGDDDLVIAMRQGLYFKILRVIPKNDNDIEIANLVAQYEDEYRADAVFIDQGYGTGIQSAGKTLGRNWRCVSFAEKSLDAGCLNKRAEMWNNTKKWLQEGGAIPPDQDLYNELIAPETVPRMDGLIQLESKVNMKKRGLPSPNRADALALTFAYPVASKGARVNRQRFAVSMFS